MTEKVEDALVIALFGEIFMADQLARARIARALPDDMEISHFSVLNHLARSGGERTPGQLAGAFNVTRGAMTNTISRLERFGWVHVRPDWEDARRKQVAISTAGRDARDRALATVAPMLAEAVAEIGAERVRGALPVLREVRKRFERGDAPAPRSSPKDRGPTGTRSRSGD